MPTKITELDVKNLSQLSGLENILLINPPEPTSDGQLSLLPFSEIGAGGSSLEILKDGSTVQTEVSQINFIGANLNISSSTANEVNIIVEEPNTGVQSVTGDGVSGTAEDIILTFPNADEIDSSATTNKFITQAQLDILSDQSGVNTGDETAASIKTKYESNLNTNAFTDSEKSKLAGLESSKFVGEFTTLASLQAAFPTAPVGSYAYVDAGVGQEVETYIWDSNDLDWIKQQGSSNAETPASIKSKYESNPDTNAFTDANVASLSNAITDIDDLQINKLSSVSVDSSLTGDGTPSNPLSVSGTLGGIQTLVSAPDDNDTTIDSGDPENLTISVNGISKLQPIQVVANRIAELTDRVLIFDPVFQSNDVTYTLPDYVTAVDNYFFCEIYNNSLTNQFKVIVLDSDGNVLQEIFAGDRFVFYPGASSSIPWTLFKLNTNVSTDNTISGDGTFSSPLSINRQAYSFVVDPNGAGGAFSTIQSAIDAAEAANSPEAILILAGQYSENLTIRRSVALHGLSAWANDITLIDGNITISPDQDASIAIVEMHINGKILLDTDDGTSTSNFYTQMWMESVELENVNESALQIANNNPETSIVVDNSRIRCTTGNFPAIDVTSTQCSGFIRGTIIARGTDQPSSSPAVVLNSQNAVTLENCQIFGQVQSTNSGSVTVRGGAGQIATLGVPCLTSTGNSTFFVNNTQLAALGGNIIDFANISPFQFFYGSISVDTAFGSTFNTSWGTQLGIDGISLSNSGDGSKVLSDDGSYIDLPNSGVQSVTGDGVSGTAEDVILTFPDADQIDSSSTTNKFITQAQLNNLSNQSGINTGDETAASIKTKYESNLNTNVFEDSEKSKLANQSGINTGDETAASVKTKYESNPDTNAFTDSEKSKLAGLESSKFVGEFISLVALQTAFPTAPVGSYAYVDSGIGQNVQKYIWDNTDTQWVEQQGDSTAETPASIKSKYESNPDTNAFTDANLSNLNNQSGTNTGDETLASLQAKRPFKTVGGQNIEGVGDIPFPSTGVQSVTGDGVSGTAEDVILTFPSAGDIDMENSAQTVQNKIVNMQNEIDANILSISDLSANKLDKPATAGFEGDILTQTSTSGEFDVRTPNGGVYKLTGIANGVSLNANGQYDVELDGNEEFTDSTQFPKNISNLYPNQDPINNKQTFLDEIYIPSTGPTNPAKWLENPVPGQVTLWRITVDYTRSSTQGNRELVLTLSNPITGFSIVEPKILPNGIDFTTTSITYNIMTIADFSSIGNGYVLNFETVGAPLTINNLSVTRTSMETL